MPPTFNKTTSCALCNQPLVKQLSLSPTPPANELFDSPTANQELYDLNLTQCQACKHLQLDTEISPFRLFKHYVYTSNTSATNYHYLYQYAGDMFERFKPKFVLDIGSNDGTFLWFFMNSKCKVLGIDPAENITKIANRNNIPTITAFFNDLQSHLIQQHHGQPDLITCNNMFAHNKNLDEILLGVESLLSPTGTFVFEVSYAKSMLEQGLFDLIYHEHYHFWHLQSAISYLSKFDLDVFDAELIPQTHGGSIRVFATHNNNSPGKSGRLKALLADEEIFLQDDLNKFKFKVPQLKGMITSLLTSLKHNNKTISILGYPAKACTLSYYFELQDFISHVYDDNPLKIGKYTHQGFLIEPATNLYKHKPDYLLLLSWNYKNELMNKHTLFSKTGGKFIIPLPKFEVL